MISNSRTICPYLKIYFLVVIYNFFLRFLRAIKVHCLNNHLPPPILFWASSSLLFTPTLKHLFVILSFHRCLSRSLGLFVFDFQLVVNLMEPSDIHTCPAHLSLLLFRTPIIFVLSYNSSIYWFVITSKTRAFLFGTNILLRTFCSSLYTSVFVHVHVPQACLIRTLYSVIFIFHDNIFDLNSVLV